MDPREKILCLIDMQIQQKSFVRVFLSYMKD